MPALTDAERSALLQVARRSVERGLDGGGVLEPEPADHPAALRETRASFTTLRRHGELRGCVGATEPQRPLVRDVAWSAHGAAFRDPRFPALTRDELPGLELHISVLGPLSPLDVASRDALIAALRPGLDGLWMEQDGRRATFLPSVWSSLPDPAQFVTELERKAGLAPESWARPVHCACYEVEEWGGEPAAATAGSAAGRAQR